MLIIKILLKVFSSSSDYRYKKDELFKRIKVPTFAQLVSEHSSDLHIVYLVVPFIICLNLYIENISC